MPCTGNTPEAAQHSGVGESMKRDEAASSKRLTEKKRQWKRKGLVAKPIKGCYGVVPIHRAAALSLTTKLLDSELSESHRLDQPDAIIINSNCPVIENSVETAIPH